MEDDLPKYICRSCLVDLNVSYRMLVRAIESQKFFYSLVSDSGSDSNVNFEHDEDMYVFFKCIRRCVIRRVMGPLLKFFHLEQKRKTTSF